MTANWEDLPLLLEHRDQLIEALVAHGRSPHEAAALLDMFTSLAHRSLQEQAEE